MHQPHAKLWFELASSEAQWSPTTRNKSRRRQDLLDVLVREQFVSLTKEGFFSDKRNLFFLNCAHYEYHCISVKR